MGPVLRAIACLWTTTLVFASPTADLSSAMEAYWNADYEAAVSHLDRVEPGELTQSERVLYYKFLAVTRLAVDEQAGAEDAFSDLLEIEPTFELDPEDFAPSVVAVFNSAESAFAQEFYLAGMRAYESADYANAADLLEKALVVDPKHRSAKDFLALAQEKVAIETRQEPAPESETPPEVPDTVPFLAKHVRDLRPDGYRVARLSDGQGAYVDRDYLISAVPDEYQGYPTVVTANDDKNKPKLAISFRVTRDATVYIAHDQRILDKPDWLEYFEPTGETVKVDESGNVISFETFKKSFSQGSVQLGGNVSSKSGQGKSMYLVFLGPG